MTKFKIAAVLVLAILFTACPENPSNGGNSNENANANGNAATAEDASAAVIESEMKAYEAWKNKDAKFFEDNLKDDFIGVSGGKVNDKEGLIKDVTNKDCTVASYELTNAKATKISDEAYLVTHQDSFDYTCGGKKVKSPEYVSSVWVKEGDQWKGAFHFMVTAADAKGDIAAIPDASTLKSSDDAITQEMGELENDAWSAWSKADTKWFEDHMAGDAVEVMWDGIASRDQLLKKMKDVKCEVDQFGIKSLKSTKLADGVYVLMYRGDLKAKCGDATLPPTVIGATVSKKGDSGWKGYLHTETPAAAGGTAKNYGPGGGG